MKKELGKSHSQWTSWNFNN